MIHSLLLSSSIGLVRDSITKDRINDINHEGVVVVRHSYRHIAITAIAATLAFLQPYRRRHGSSSHTGVHTAKGTHAKAHSQDALAVKAHRRSGSQDTDVLAANAHTL